MISVIGTGPGDRLLLTAKAQQAIAGAEILLGWPRLLAEFPDFAGERIALGADVDGLMSWLRCHQDRNVALLASGDPLLFGIGKRISEAIAPDKRQFISGISAVQQLFAEVGLAMNDVYLTSSHGQQPDFDFLFQHRKVALVTDNQIGPYQLAQQAIARRLDCTFIIGERLSYADQRISILKPAQVAKQYQINVVVIVNERQ